MEFHSHLLSLVGISYTKLENFNLMIDRHGGFQFVSSPFNFQQSGVNNEQLFRYMTALKSLPGPGQGRTNETVMPPFLMHLQAANNKMVLIQYAPSTLNSACERRAFLNLEHHLWVWKIPIKDPTILRKIAK
ncbi:hypothetical protein HYFRA_00011840 [Hymenoscyphus fraxineus]|uniref:Uncharacterized protein n=1 Tax=Hymenoscyphus fraxineus TaxID=746836 RepID=A0A9N9L1X1_9HELO|nr:hypothetical protein HYFRA_00011840 [Hymenoscyphus fraxineus]